MSTVQMVDLHIARANRRKQKLILLMKKRKTMSTRCSSSLADKLQNLTKNLRTEKPNQKCTNITKPAESSSSQQTILMNFDHPKATLPP